GGAQTDRHSVSCIVMQRPENVSDAFFLFTPWKTSLFAVFASESRSARFNGAYNTGVMVNGSVFREGSTGFAVGCSVSD
ncbi:hypothetical protein, partial [Escherichia coli]|uniref:hypothetical protein n=1 Tax=Escherichia coli TaxID=562 RepID=UPI00201EE7E1